MILQEEKKAEHKSDRNVDARSTFEHDIQSSLC